MINLSEVLFVDACCCHQANKGSWAVVGENVCQSGVMTCENGRVNSDYCELYAIYQALKIPGKKQTVIPYPNYILSLWL